MLSASKFIASVSISGPSKTSKPKAWKISRKSRSTVISGWRWPIRTGRPGALMSMPLRLEPRGHVPAGRAPPAAAAIAASSSRACLVRELADGRADPRAPARRASEAGRSGGRSGRAARPAAPSTAALSAFDRRARASSRRLEIAERRSSVVIGPSSSSVQYERPRSGFGAGPWEPACATPVSR